MTRFDGRAANELRPIEFIPHFTRWAEGSVLTKFGDTHVLCNVTLEAGLPSWLKNRENPHGWLTAEYAMLPRSTHTRSRREQRWPKGRTQEISRLIGRSLRMALDLHQLGEHTMIVDCDVLQADGGTRTAAVTGGWVAVSLALQSLIRRGVLPHSVVKHQIAAVSAGVVDGDVLLDLPYEEDSRAEVDCNVVMTADGRLIEVQSTAETIPSSREAFNQLLDLAAQGVEALAKKQREIIK
ncbi:MAG: ribonuclease PH [Ardenticatenaceae bacterium]|nr:ribonuclease PH [Ardenticatenaceae bacterium]